MTIDSLYLLVSGICVACIFHVEFKGLLHGIWRPDAFVPRTSTDCTSEPYDGECVWLKNVSVEEKPTVRLKTSA